MKRSGFENYRLVYSHLWKTYGQSWYIRSAFLIRFASRVFKLVVLPVLVSQMIANITQSDFDGARSLLVMYVAGSLVITLLTPLGGYVAILGENPVYAKSMRMYFQKLVNVDIHFFNSSQAGYITVATRQYSDNTLLMTRSLYGRYMNTVLSILLPIIVIIKVNYIIGLSIIALSIVQVAYLLWASIRIAPLRTISREHYKKTSGFISDAVSNILAIKSSAQEVKSSEKVGMLMQKESNAFLKRYISQAQLVLPRELITTFFLAIVFIITVNMASSGTIGVAGVVLVMTYVLTILTGLYVLSDDIDQHDDFVDKILPAFEVLDRENIVHDPDEPREFSDIKGSVVLRDIEFSYKEENSNTVVFKHLNIIIPAGQKIGVVGLSGAGKSTLAKLLLRFDDIDSGSITVDDIDIRDVLQADLRRQIAYVPQEPLLFHSTIKENVLLSKPDANDNEVAAAIKSAHAAGFIEQLPDKLDSIVGERGVKLSGGQKQRIAIARAVLQNSPIIILDEATSALDSESEDIIKSSFKEILKGKTAVVVAHRLSTLSNMDRIIVIDKGEIVEDGSHEQLVARKGLYATLWKRQQMHLEEPYVGDTNEA